MDKKECRAYKIRKVFSQLLIMDCIIDGLSLMYYKYKYYHIMTQSASAGVIYCDVDNYVDICSCAYDHKDFQTMLRYT